MPTNILIFAQKTGYEFRNIGLCNILRLKRSGEDEDERTRCLSQDERIGDYQQLHNPML